MALFPQTQSIKGCTASAVGPAAAAATLAASTPGSAAAESTLSPLGVVVRCRFFVVTSHRTLDVSHGKEIAIQSKQTLLF